jgi:probable phosphoglycerate mutase
MIGMLFFYLRHGDPIYSPDSLTPLGIKQAEALAKRLALYGIDKIFSSPSKRAMQTAQPTCDLLRKEPVVLDFCNESLVLRDLTIQTGDKRTWLFQDPNCKRLFADQSIRELADKWYLHPQLKQYDYEKGIRRISEETDQFFLSLGYEHIPDSGSYKVIRPNNERVALFAHQGFGIAFLSCLLDIPYPQFCNHFDLSHSSMTVINFKEEDGYATPKVLTLSSDSHLYREGLPLKYNYGLSF